MNLLDLYKSRFGTAVKAQGNGWNGPCPLCGGESGKSDRFVVWPDRDESLGETCAKNQVTGIWSCRQCGRSGDTIAYLMQVDGLDFKAALAELGIEGGRTGYRRRPAPQEPRRQRESFTPRVWPEPSPEWQSYATKLLEEATARIADEPNALRWLAARGITAEAIAQYRIGYLPAEGAKYPGRWRYRSALGLAPKQKEGGATSQKIFIPRGIIIPTFAPDAAGGKLLNLRIRRHKADLQPMPSGKLPPKYMELEGSCKAPLLLRAAGPAHLAAYFVTEAELDAMLIHYATGGAVGAVAVRTNRGKPDATAHERLSAAVKVCVALDYDAAVDERGQEYVPADAPGSQGLDWWEQTYAQYLRWPTPEGKDPGDAFRLGVDIRQWVAAALPASIALPAESPATRGAERHDHRHDGGEPRSASAAGTTLPASESECPAGRGAERHLMSGSMDTCAAGLPNGGGGAEPESPAPEEGGPAGFTQTRTSEDNAHIPHRAAFTPDELAHIEGALPLYLTLADVPVDVCRAWLLWQDVPASFAKQRDEGGHSVGFAWHCDPAWKRTHAAAFDAFWRFQDSSRTLWDWMSEHREMKITARNLLRIWG